MWNDRTQTRNRVQGVIERDGVDASKACHISGRVNVRSPAAGSGSAGPEAGALSKCYHPAL
jgi:hypothetical protein